MLQQRIAEQFVHDPVRRQRYLFAEDGGELRAEVWTAPGGDVPEHLHPNQEERWEVVSGTVTFRVAGEKRGAQAGDIVVAPAGAWHAFQNTGAEEALLRVSVRPALSLRAFLEEAAALAREGKFNRYGVPKGLGAAQELADLAERHRDVMVLRRPPLALQRLLLAPLAARHRRRSGASHPARDAC